MSTHQSGPKINDNEEVLCTSQWLKTYMTLHPIYLYYKSETANGKLDEALVE